MKTPNKSTINIENYRKLVQTYINVHMYNSALFWADKVVALTGDPRDIYWLAQCMYLQKEYHRAVHLLKSRNLEKAYILCNYLTVKCLLEANELNEALKVINLLDIDVFQSNITSTPSLNNVDHMLFDDTPKNQIFSSVMYLKGKVLENMDNRGLAADCYKQALYFDVYCFDAFDSLIRYQMLTAAEEQDLLNSLPISEQCSAEESEVLRVLYESKLKKYHTPTQEKLMINTPLHKAKFTQNIIASLPGTPSIVVTASPTIKSTPNVSKTNDKNLKRLKTIDERVQKLDGPVLVKLNDSLDMHVSQAERLYYNCDFQQCSELTEAILRQDPYHSSCLPIHISCQVELKESNKLFSLAHTLVDLYPDLAISWFAVGCYYYILGKSDYARRYLAKATCLDRLFGPAWLAYGHSFAIEKEHDQAMAAYFKASQLMKGCHLPLLYIGLECGLTNNVRLAEKFFSQAQSIAPDDPFILHEKGVICFQNLEYLEAEKNFKDALTKIKSVKRGLIPKSWCALLNNLGHTCRKLRKYQEALEYHEQALLLTPQCAPTYSAIGYCHVLLRNNEEAVDWFHKALGLRRADSFSATMLNYVIEQLSEEQPAFPGAPDTLPKFNLSRTPAAVQETLEELDLEESSKMETTNNEMSMSMEMSDASGMVKDD